MRQDIVIGIAVAALLHGGVFLEAVLNPNRPPVRQAVKAADVIRLSEPPKYEPDEPVKPDPIDEPAKTIDIALPTQIDVPQVVPTNAFTQAVQPLPPPDAKTIEGITTIPLDRTYSPSKFSKVFDPTTLDEQPVPRMRTPPQYPFEMKSKGMTGEVTVDFIVDASGSVQNAYALRSTQREFEDAAVQAVSKWKFKAGRKGGAAVNTHMQVPIVFSLNDD